LFTALTAHPSKEQIPILNNFKIKADMHRPQQCNDAIFWKSQQGTYFNLPLSSIRGMVLKNLDSNDLIGAFLPALYNL
jgi:hypothetical protein